MTGRVKEAFKKGFTVSLMAAALMAPTHSAGPGLAAVDLSGFWELRDDSKHVPDAQLVDAFKSTSPQPMVNNVVLYASRWCHPMGMPFIMGDSAPLDLIQGKQELAITAEVQSSARHIYLDRRAHPAADEFDPTSNGHSVGHWEGRVLVVDTVGFNEVGNRSIPGGGLRGTSSHLVERFELRKGRTQLNVRFTWTDPRVFARPHVYDFTYYKAQPGEYAREYFCDASDPARGESVHPPEP